MIIAFERLVSGQRDKLCSAYDRWLEATGDFKMPPGRLLSQYALMPADDPLQIVSIWTTRAAEAEDRASAARRKLRDDAGLPFGDVEAFEIHLYRAEAGFWCRSPRISAQRKKAGGEADFAGFAVLGKDVMKGRAGSPTSNYDSAMKQTDYIPSLEPFGGLSHICFLVPGGYKVFGMFVSEKAERVAHTSTQALELWAANDIPAPGPDELFKFNVYSYFSRGG